MNEDRRIGQMAGIRWAAARLRMHARNFGPGDDADILKAAAHDLVVYGKALRNDDADDITAGLEALSKPIIAEWGEVKDRLNLGDGWPGDVSRVQPVASGQVVCFECSTMFPIGQPCPTCNHDREH